MVVEAVVLQIRCVEEDKEQLEFRVSGHIIPHVAIRYGATVLRTGLTLVPANGRVLYEVPQLNSDRSRRLRAFVVPLPEDDSAALQPIPVVTGRRGEARLQPSRARLHVASTKSPHRRSSSPCQSRSLI